MIHLDKALARIREYERMKLKVEFNPCDANSAGAGGSEVHLSANPAGVEGTQTVQGCWNTLRSKTGSCTIIHCPLAV